jgi:hypothetical protein
LLAARQQIEPILSDLLPKARAVCNIDAPEQLNPQYYEDYTVGL